MCCQVSTEMLRTTQTKRYAVKSSKSTNNPYQSVRIGGGFFSCKTGLQGSFPNLCRISYRQPTKRPSQSVFSCILFGGITEIVYLCKWVGKLPIYMILCLRFHRKILVAAFVAKSVNYTSNGVQRTFRG